MSAFWRLPLRLLGAGRGRAAAFLLLLLAAFALAWVESTPLSGLQNLLFDHYQRLWPRDRSAIPVEAIVVGIDEKSLHAQGQWPWPRDLVARLIDRLHEGEPLAVGLDILFVEPDRFDHAELARRLPGLPPAVLAGSPDPDQLLAEALARGPTVLAVSGQAENAPNTRSPARSVTLLSRGGTDPEVLPAFPAALLSLPTLEAAAKSEGIINAAPDRTRRDADQGVLRRVPLLARVGLSTLPSLGLEMTRLALEENALVTEGNARELARVGVGDYRLPVLPDGGLLLHFGPQQNLRYLSATDVLSGAQPPETWHRAFVIVALTGQGLLDTVVTPLGEKVPGAEIHLQIIESLLTGEGLRRPPWMKTLELAVLLTGGLFLLIALPRLRPVYAAGMGGALAATLLAAGHIAFAAGHWLFDSISIVTLLNPLFIVLLGNVLIEADTRRRRAEQALQASREAAARDAGELDAARRIQMGLLPALPALFRSETRFRVAAILEPARAVGGDYFDCFPLDSRRIFFAVGDVSGKGVPASLFMTMAKTLSGALTRRAASLSEALGQAQIELNRNNPEMLFVTTLVAILDADEGLLTWISAGHDAPILLRRGQSIPVSMESAGGPPLCALDTYVFQVASERLQPGDLLCVFTDGVTEATDGTRFFGKEGLLAALTGKDAALSPETVVQTVKEAVRRFEAGHPPADDLTLLALRWAPEDSK